MALTAFSKDFLRTKTNEGGLFDFQYELSSLCLGIFVLCISVIYFFWGNENFDNASRQIMRFIVGGFFVNSIHIYFTYALLFTLPEFIRWPALLTPTERISIGLKGLLVFIVSILFFFGNFGGMEINTWVLFAGTLAFIVIPIHHSLMQIKGISLLYNKKLENNMSPRNLSKMKKIEALEKAAFSGLLFFYVTYVSLLTIGSRFNDYTTARSLIPFFFFLYFMCIVVVISSSVFIPHTSGRIFKTAFLLRLFLFTLIPFSFAAQLAHGSLHGTEYLCIVEKARRNSTASTQQRPRVILALILASISGLIFLFVCPEEGLTKFFWERYSESPIWVHTLGAFSFGLTFLHYFLDRKLFNANFLASRELILPLISKPPNTLKKI